MVYDIYFSLELQLSKMGNGFHLPSSKQVRLIHISISNNLTWTLDVNSIQIWNIQTLFELSYLPYTTNPTSQRSS